MPARDTIVAQLKDVVGTALDEWARSSDVQDEVQVTPSSTLVFDLEQPQLNVQLSSLRRIFTNISEHANSVVAFMEEDKPTSGRNSRLTSSLRKLYTIRDTAAQMARLLGGYDLADESVFVAPVSGEYEISTKPLSEDDLPEGMVPADGRTVPLPGGSLDPIPSSALLLAETHKEIRSLASELRGQTKVTFDPDYFGTRCEDIARTIRGANNG